MKNKVVVITGAGGVLCAEFAKEVARHGAKVVLLDINLDAAQAVVDEIEKDTQHSGMAKAFAVSVLDRAALEAVRDEITAEFGSCDILINGAGGNNPKGTTDCEYHDPTVAKTFFDLEREGFTAVFDLNIMGTVIPSQVFARDMIGKSDCCVLNVASMSGYTPLTKIPAYSAAKCAIVNFTQWLAVHLSREGIRVNAISPGFFVTKQNEALLYNADGTPTARTDKILRATPMGRFGEASELLGALMFLIDSSKSGFVTGVTLPVDGGFSAYSGV